MVCGRGYESQRALSMAMDSSTAKIFSKETAERVGGILNDANKSLSERFRALFTLRGIAGHEAISEIGRCFNDQSALLKHECAYCLGQIQDPYAIPLLRDVLEDTKQEPMVKLYTDSEYLRKFRRLHYYSSKHDQL